MALETSKTALDAALDLLADGEIVALTGAGISTDSGIPDYRGPGSPPRRPMTYQEFVSGPGAQQRYWARAHVGWGHMRAARPNDGHLALAQLQRAGAIRGLISQNVDGLHGSAGSPQVIDLHGRIADVVCLACRVITSRAELHERLEVLNPGWADQRATIAPDGDVQLDDTAGFHIAACRSCGGPLKPDVVFFGENVPRERVARAIALVDQARVLLVVGSSLQVMSGLRFVRQAAKADKPVVIINRGTTRGDPLATVRVDSGCSQTLRLLADRVGADA